MPTLRLGRFRVKTSNLRAPAPFSKMDLVRTKRRLSLERLPPAYEELVSQLGWGSLGGTIELCSPDEVVERTTKLRARPLPHPPPWSDPARLPTAVVLASIAFGDLLVWFPSHDRYVRVPVEPSHHPADLGADFFTALETILHLAGDAEAVELAAPRR